MRKNSRERRNAAGLLALLALLLIADTLLFLMAEMPRIENAAEQKQWEGLDLLKRYRDYPDMIGWLQVDGTDINYPVMCGDKYLHRNFSGDYDESGCLFVEEGWSPQDVCTLIYGHNMWMYGTMFSSLHRFANAGFFHRNRDIRFYVVQDRGAAVEKRTYEIRCCIRTRVDEWNYAGCRYICSLEELAAFEEECGKRAVQKKSSEMRAMGECGEVVVLSTCSYHVKGRKGRLLLVGKLKDRSEQNRIDVVQR